MFVRYILLHVVLDHSFSLQYSSKWLYCSLGTHIFHSIVLIQAFILLSFEGVCTCSVGSILGMEILIYRVCICSALTDGAEQSPKMVLPIYSLCQYMRVLVESHILALYVFCLFKNVVFSSGCMVVCCVCINI